jgi:hypothetical protein
VNAPAERNHELMVPALHRPKVGEDRVLVVGSAECHLESGIRLEEPIKSGIHIRT